MDPVQDSAWLQSAMELPVTASLGPMAAVLRQLHSEHNRPEGVSEAKIQRLLRCLGGLCITLKDLSDQVHEPCFTALCWMKQVRELCFDTQDYFDQVSPAGSDDGVRTARARLSNIIWFHRRPQTKTARDFLELRARAVDASKRRRRLKLGTTSFKQPETESCQAGVSHRRTPRTPLLEQPMDDLVRLLAFDDKKEKQLKVITIFGFAGVGKTTAAKTMYHKHAWKFQCRAFLRVSRNPNMRWILTSILSQIKAQPPTGFPDVQDLIEVIKTHLQGKRYFIILDDLWASMTWDIISCAFPHGDYGSRIIATTEIKDVAVACSRPHLKHKYDMIPLKPEQSKQLFFSTVFGSGGHCPQELKDISDTIISKCGGLPLVIACVCSLLASERNLVLGQWKQLSDSLPFSLTTNPTHDGMKEFVNSMYNALPPYLKTYLLYLSMYPESYIVWKDDLVNQWLAEGLIGAEDNAGVYFDELVSRGMVQAVDISCDGEVLSCTVHHMVLDLIRHKSIVQNFIVIVGCSPAIAGLPDKVHRLSVQFGGAKFANIPTGFRISQARSYVYFGYIDCVLSVEKYKLLRVLILHTWSDQDKDHFDLTRISELFLLRYLKVQCNITVQLPEEIRRLQYLETLQVDAKIAAVPSDIFHLEKLLHLRLPSECVLPDGFDRFTSLRTLGYFDLGSHSEDNVMDLAKLTNLKDLQLTCSTVQLAENQEKIVKLLCSILENLRGLQSVTLAPTTGSSPVKIPCSVSPLALTLQRIELSQRCCIFFSVPQWLGELRVLRVLMVAIRGLSMNAIDILKVLPSLTALTLYVQTAPAERIAIKEGGFPVLTYFKFMCAAVPSLYFELGAMPHVQKLKLGFNLHKRKAHSLQATGFSYLTGLIEICVKFGTCHVDESTRKATESALEVALSKHPNTLIVKIQSVDVIFGGKASKSIVTEEKDNKSTVVEEQDDMTLKKRREIQQGKKKSMGPSAEHANETVHTRYGRTWADAQSVNHMTGAMGSLLPKLGELLLEEYNLLKNLKKGIKDLRDELLIIEALLVKVSNVPLDQLDPLVKIWANDVRELSYAIEDSLDSFMVHVDGAEQEKQNTFLGFIKKTCKKVTKLKIRREIASEIKDVKIQVKEVKEWYDRYKDVTGNSSAAAKVDPRLIALYDKVSNLVGISEAMDEAKKMLSESHDVSHQNPRIISVVGFGGLGKTTLAKAVYDDLHKKFDCGSFVPVGQNPDTRKVLRDIVLELDMELYRAAATMDERQLINQLQKFLAGKRYFIVIDDIWNISTWETIKCAFVDSHPESRIILTTRIVDVATKAGGIYRMKPLSYDNSRILFHRRTCGGDDVSKDNQPGEVVDKILKKCGGVPLAIITIASLLVDKPRADWFKVYDAIGFGNQGNDDVLNTRKILSFSYYDLRPYLKTCLLYLRIYPEDRFIDKRRLIWRWICEGFVPDNQGMGAFMLGESYYNELVNKNMIRDIDEEGCYVHDLVLDLIHTISTEVNFVTVHDTRKKEITSLPNGRSNKLHRLALHGAKVKHNSDIQMDHVRSFTAIMCSNSGMPPLSIFKVLRVLVIVECGFLEGHNLEHVGKLVQLRYLGLVETAVKLPEGIGHDLKFLEVLDVRGGKICELPPSVGELNNLRCLWASDGTIMKGNIGKLTSLEELEIYSVEGCPNFFTELGHLTNLRALKIEIGELEETTCKALAELLYHLHMFQCLDISSSKINEAIEFYKRELHVRAGSLEELVPSTRLRHFVLSGVIIPRLPSWINSLCVPLLSELCLYVEVVEAQDLQTLGRLPSLCLLALVSEVEKRISYTFGSDDFPKLEALVTNIEITLEEVALPMLHFLVYRVIAGRKDRLVPWNKTCPLLKNVTCLLDCSNSGWKEVKAAEAVLKKAKRAHPNLDLVIESENYDRKAARLIDALGSILHSLDRPDGEEITAEQRDIRRMIKSLETLLRDDDEPRVGMYGEQELRGIVTRLKSWLHDHAGTHQEEEVLSLGGRK